MPKTVAQKLWDAHIVTSTQGEPDLLFVDLHLVHEVTSAQAFEGLRLAGRRVRRPAVPESRLGARPGFDLAAQHAGAAESQ